MTPSESPVAKTQASGDPGRLRRLAGEIVPLGVGVIAANLLLPLGPVAAVVGGILAWVVVSAVLRRVRRHPVLRRLYRLAVLAHVVFWSWLGIRAAEIRPPGPVVVERVADWDGVRSFRAGVGGATFELPPGTTLAGFGNRPRRAAYPAFGGLGAVGRWSLSHLPGQAHLFHEPTPGEHDLGARALVLLPDGEGPPLVWVRLDLLLVGPPLVGAVEARIRGEGLEDAVVLVSATHTHSGPGGMHDADLAEVAGTDRFDEQGVEAMAAAAGAAVSEAVARARPARIAFGRLADRDAAGSAIVARNRRRAEDDIDDRMLSLAFFDEQDRCFAVLLQYAVHPTTLGRHQMGFDRDIAGRLEEYLQEGLPGRPLVLFVNGAQGDVTARPAAVPRDERADALAARLVAEAPIEALLGGERHGRIRVRSVEVIRDMGTPRLMVGIGSRRALEASVEGGVFGDGPASGPASVAAGVLTLPVNVLIWSLGLSEVRTVVSFEGAAGAVVTLEEAVGDSIHRFGAVAIEPEGEPDAGALVLWLGGEATTALGRRWRARAEDAGRPVPMISGLTNDTLLYVTTAAEYERGDYEGSVTLYGSRTGTLVEDALFAAAGSR